MKTHLTKSAEETIKLAKEFALTLRGGELIELIGDLGAGKTTFVRGIAEVLGAKVKVKSPTFAIMNEYPVEHARIKKIIHLDFYRFENPSQMEALALGDYQKDDTIVLVEWPDIFGTPILTPTHKIQLSFIDENTREITL